MNKKLSIFAIILIIVGLVGTVWSGVNAMPYFMKEISRAEKEAIKEETIYNEELEETKKLKIYTTNSNVIIRENNENKIKINKLGNNENFKYDVDYDKNYLTVKELKNDLNSNLFSKDFKDLFNKVIDSIVSINNGGVVVYLPKNVDLEVVTINGSLYIEDSIDFKNIDFKTSYGKISLPKETKNIDTLNIFSSNNIYLDVTEILGINNINIECGSVNIYSNENYMFIENIEDFIPNNINITENNQNEYSNNIYISSNIPVAKHLNIVSNNSYVTLDIPIEKYNINFDVQTSDSIVFNQDSQSNDVTYEEVKVLKGNLNKSLENLNNQYNIKCKSNVVEIR